MPTYTLTLSEGFAIESLRRYRAQSFGRLGRWSLKAICYVGLSVLLVIFIYAKIYIISAIFAFLIVLVLLGPKFDYWWIGRQFRKSPFHMEVLRIQINDEGYREVTSIGSAEYGWAALTNLVRFKDGYLLFITAQVFRWLPDLSIVEGSIDDVRCLFDKHHKIEPGA
jgi:hypothetical protein